jgi:hypothetical protein
VRSSSRFFVILATIVASSTVVTDRDGLAADGGSASTELITAAEHGDVAALERRLAAGEPVDARDDRGLTPLHHAAMAGQLNAASFLLDHGADPNARAEGEMTPLHFAAMLAHPELAGMLARRGARSDVRNASGLVPLHLAADDKVVNVLAAAGADVNALSSKGMTPLHTARHGLAARALVDLKADIRIRTPRGRTAMETAGIETFERFGLSIHSVMLGRLRGLVGQMPVTLTNVSDHPIRDLAIVGRSPGCRVDVTPASVAQVLPGQNADYVLTLSRNVEAAPGEYPVYVALSIGGTRIGETDLKVDTRMSETPQDRGMIRLAKGRIQPPSSRWFYLVYASVPLLVMAAWFWLRRR